MRYDDPIFWRAGAVATFAYLQWMSAINTNGFPIHFSRISVGYQEKP